MGAGGRCHPSPLRGGRTTYVRLDTSPRKAALPTVGYVWKMLLSKRQHWISAAYGGDGSLSTVEMVKVLSGASESNSDEIKAEDGGGAEGEVGGSRNRSCSCWCWVGCTRLSMSLVGVAIVVLKGEHINRPSGRKREKQPRKLRLGKAIVAKIQTESINDQQ